MNNKVLSMLNMLYYFAYFLLIFQSMTRWVNLSGISLISKISTLLIPIILLLVFIKRNQKISRKNILLIIVLIILTLVSMMISKGTAIWTIILFIIATKDMNVSNIIKFDFVIKSILIIMVYLLYRIGLTDNVIIYRGDNVLRYGLGFGHPNTFSVYLMGICLDFLYLNYNSKYKKISYIIIILAILFISVYCDSRSVMYTLVIALILSLLIPFIKNKKLFSFLASNSPFIFLIVSFISTILYKHRDIFPFVISLNEFFSNRLLLMYQFFDRYSIHFFGNYFIDYHTQSTSTASVLDNAYMLLLIKFGLVITILFVSALSKQIKKSFKDNHLGLTVCTISFVFFGLMENGLFVLAYNPFLLFLSNLIFEDKKKVNYDENQ